MVTIMPSKKKEFTCSKKDLCSRKTYMGMRDKLFSILYMYSLFSADISWAVIRISSRKLIWIELISKWKEYLNNLSCKHTKH